MQIVRELTKLGLSEKEAKVYIAGLELGKATILELSKKAEVKRGTCYEIVMNLSNLGLFKKTLKK
jgi:sugar-specific transcriptional regulator TrmB